MSLFLWVHSGGGQLNPPTPRTSSISATCLVRTGSRWNPQQGGTTRLLRLTSALRWRVSGFSYHFEFIISSKLPGLGSTLILVFTSACALVFCFSSCFQGPRTQPRVSRSPPPRRRPDRPVQVKWGLCTRLSGGSQNPS